MVTTRIPVVMYLFVGITWLFATLEGEFDVATLAACICYVMLFVDRQAKS